MPEKCRQYEHGQGLLEYALIILLAAGVLFLGLSLMGVNIGQVFTDIIASLGANAQNAAAPGEDTGNTDSPDKGSLFSDDFSGGLSGWFTAKTGIWKGNWDTKNGRLMGDSLGAAFMSGFWGSDYRVTLGDTSMSSKRDPYNGYGVFFRTQNGKQVEGYLFEYERKNSKDPGMMYFSKWVKGVQVVPPIASAPMPANFNWSNPGSLSVSVIGNQFTAYQNGEKLLQGSDDTYKEGGAGVAVNLGSAVSIDSINIDPLP